MKKSWSYIALLAALAAGTASAAGTAAGTQIKNTAEIIFTPEGGSTPVTTPSNEVTTTVLPVPSFTITPNDGSTTVTVPNYSSPGQTATVKPCDKNVVFKYVLTNTGNLPNESYALTNTPDPTGVVKTPDNIRYYLDRDNSGTFTQADIDGGAVTSITGVNQDQAVTFFQVYDIPCTALDTDKFGGDPTGTRNDNPAFNNDPSVPADANNSNSTTVSRNDGQYVGPKDDANADNKTDSSNNTNANTPYSDVTPGDTSNNTVYPGGTTIPGSTTPVPADEQQVVGTCTTASTTVTFTNTVTNTGNRADTMDITYASTFPAGTTVQLLKLDGTPLTDTETPADGTPDTGPLAPATYSGGTMTAPGGSFSFLVRVTYTGCLPANGTVTVTSTSSNNTSAKDITKDTILAPALSFGDPTPTPGGDPNPVGTPPAGTPGNPGSPVNVENCTAPIRTFVPMEIANLGGAPDLYNVSGTAPIKLIDGTTQTVPVIYYKDVNGSGTLDAGDTPLTDSSADADTTPDTGLIAPGTEVKLVAVVDVPCAAAAQTITLNQTATSPLTGVSVTDPNDTITVGKTPVAAPDKKILVNGVPQNASDAKPGDTITYQIIGKNTSNSNITKAMVCDAPPANTSFVSWAAVSSATGSVLYSNNGGTSWTAAQPTSAGTGLCAAVDTNGDGTISTADVLKPGESITVTFQVKVN